MTLRGKAAWAVATMLLASARPLPGQDPKPLEVGQPAPDFALAGASRFGPFKDSVRLSDFRGQTVVLAFFYKARTKG